VRPLPAPSRRPTPLLLLPLLLACTGDSFTVAPDMARLGGRWMLRDSSVVTVRFLGTSFENICVVEGALFDIASVEGDTLWVATQAPGGMYTCQNNDVVYARGPLPFTGREYVVAQHGAQVRWLSDSGTQVYTGRLFGRDSMSGARDSAFDGRRGEWWGARQ
jgi:hypothetical protein